MTERVWTYEVHELNEGFSAIVYDENGQRIADHLSEERARLIAAAPELLEALRLASNKFAFAAGLADPMNKNMFLQGAKSFCDAALAKAGA